MTKTTKTTERISVNDIKAGHLPTDATGVHWTDTDWTECRAHLTDQSWSDGAADSDDPTGIVLTGDVTCDWDHKEA